MCSLNKINKYKYDFLSLFFILLILFLFFNKAILLKNIFITGDLTISDLMNQNYPRKVILHESLRRFELPLWSNYIWCGSDVFAQGEIAALYPPNLILFFLFKPHIAYNLVTILNFFLCAIFIYFFCKELMKNSSAALFSSVTFMLSSFFVLHLKHLNMINAAIYLPLLFLLAERLLKPQTKKKIFIFVILGGIVIAISIFAGHLQMTYYSILFFFLYFYVFYIINLKKLKDKIIIFFAPFIMIIIGVLVAAVQLLPSYEYAKISGRLGKAFYEASLDWQFRVKDLITFILPFYFGDFAKGTYIHPAKERVLFWENTTYCGILPLLLSILAIIVYIKKSWHVRFFIVLFILSILLALPKSPLYKFIYDTLPFFQGFRFPNRFLLYAQLSISILAGFGICFLIKKLRKAALFILPFLFIFLIYDLFKFGKHQNPTVPVKDYLTPPATCSFLKKDKDLFRIATFAGDPAYQNIIYPTASGYMDLTPYILFRNLMQEELNVVYGIESAFGYGALRPLRLSCVYFHYLYQRIGIIDGKAYLGKHWSRILGIMNVKYLLSLYPIESPFFKQVYQTSYKYKDIPQVKIYKNEDFLERVYIAKKYKLVKNELEILDTLCREDFNPKEEVILEEDIGDYGSEELNYNIKIKKYTDREILIEVEATGAGILVLSKFNYPGWYAYINNKPTKILSANYLMSAIKINKGKHLVKFYYSPASFKIGSLISIFSIIIILFLTLMIKWKK